MKLPEPQPPEPVAKKARPNRRIRKHLWEQKAAAEAEENEPTGTSEPVEARQLGDTTSCNPPVLNLNVSPIPSPRLNPESTGKGKERTKNPEKEVSVLVFGSRHRD